MSRPKLTWVPKAQAERCTSCGDKGADAHFRIAALNFYLCPACVKELATGTTLLVDLHYFAEKTT